RLRAAAHVAVVLHDLAQHLLERRRGGLGLVVGPVRVEERAEARRGGRVGEVLGLAGELELGLRGAPELGEGPAAREPARRVAELGVRTSARGLERGARLLAEGAELLARGAALAPLPRAEAVDERRGIVGEVAHA